MTYLITLHLPYLGILLLGTSRICEAFLEAMKITRGLELDLPRLFYCAKVMPEFLPICPIELANVTFYNGREQHLGLVYSHRDMKEPPHVYWSYNSSLREYYTMSIVNLDDFLSKIGERLQWHIWLVGNIPRNRIALGDTLIEYEAPVETRDKLYQASHRVAVFVWRQPGGNLVEYNGPILTSSDHRWNYTIHRFTQKYHLEGPCAGTYFNISQ